MRLGAEVGPLEGPRLALAPVERDGPLLGPLGPAGPLLLLAPPERDGPLLGPLGPAGPLLLLAPPEREGVVRAGTPEAVR